MEGPKQAFLFPSLPKLNFSERLGIFSSTFALVCNNVFNQILTSSVFQFQVFYVTGNLLSMFH